jgi:transposase InsO family protein
VLVDPWVPYPRTPASIRARLFVIVDDHSRLLVRGRFHPVENTRAGQEVLRAAIVHRGLPEILYADNGAPFHNHALARTCAVLGVRLVHSAPYSPEGRGKQERLNRFIRERFITKPNTPASRPWPSSTTGSRRGPNRSPTGASTPKPTRRRSADGRREDRHGLSTRFGCGRRSCGPRPAG